MIASVITLLVLLILLTILVIWEYRKNDGRVWKVIGVVGKPMFWSEKRPAIFVETWSLSPSFYLLESGGIRKIIDSNQLADRSIVGIKRIMEFKGLVGLLQKGQRYCFVLETAKEKEE